MAITEIYVDPSIAADSGSGTVGDPYGDLEYAIEQGGQGAGTTRINLKTGTDEVLAAELLAGAFTTGGWSFGTTTPIIIEGYSTTAGDLRGTTATAGISGGGASIVFFSGAAQSHIYFNHLHIHNFVGNAIALGNTSGIFNCEINNITGQAIQSMNSGNSIVGNYFHDISSQGIASTADNNFIAYNHFANGTKSFNNVIDQCRSMVFRNTFDLSGSTNGIDLATEGAAIQNSVYCAGGTGMGIRNRSGQTAQIISNNLVEGFSGSGGVGIDYGFGTNGQTRAAGGNSVYNCETAFGPSDIDSCYVAVGTEADETLTASPFTDAANGDFSPVDTGNVKESGFPQIIGGGLV